MSEYRVIYIDEIVNIGGGETCLINMLNSIDNNTVKKFIYCSEGKIADFCKKNNIEVINCNFLYKDMSNKTLLKVILNFIHRVIDSIKLAIIIKKHNIDVIHSISSTGHVIASITKYLSNAKTIWQMHYKVNSMVVNYFSADRIVHVSNNLLNELGYDSKNNLDKYSVIHNGIEIEKFSIHENFSKINTIGFVGRIMPEKGLDELLEAFSILKKSTRFPDLKLKIFGEELYDAKRKGNYTSQLKDKVKTLGLEDSISFCGHVFPQQSIYEQIDLLILPSYQEAFPMVILEAAASGVPVIASDVGGVSEFITECETGFMVPPKNVAKLVEKIEFVLKNTDITAKCAINARKLVEEKFTAKINADKFLILYKDLINTK